MPAIDFETANGKRSSICSIGIAIIEDNKVIDSIYTLVRPYPNFYTRFTTAVHGITMQDTIDSPDFEEVWSEIAGKLQDIPLVAHNSPFDEGCLRAAHEAYDLAYPKYQFYCTCRLSRRMYPFLVNHQLQTVAAHCGYDLTYHHHAMARCLCLCAYRGNHDAGKGSSKGCVIYDLLTGNLVHYDRNRSIARHLQAVPKLSIAI